MIKILNDGQPLIAKKTDRNALCSCGSGKKSKKCCNTETKYYIRKEQPKE